MSVAAPEKTRFPQRATVVIPDTAAELLAIWGIEGDEYAIWLELHKAAEDRQLARLAKKPCPGDVLQPTNLPIDFPITRRSKPSEIRVWDEPNGGSRIDNGDCQLSKRVKVGPGDTVRLTGLLITFT